MLNVETGEVTGTQRPAKEDDELRIYVIISREAGDRMSTAKLGVQVAHATLSAFVLCQMRDPDRAHLFMQVAQPKIVLEVPTAAELRSLHERANLVGYAATLITDAGRTEFAEPTTTAVGIGPIWWRKEARKLLKRLQTYRD